MSILPSLKVCLDLSAEYLILSDVQRKVGALCACYVGTGDRNSLRCVCSAAQHWGLHGQS